MKLLEKIVVARKQFAQENVKKSGKNNYSQAKYFELSDIVPVITRINAEIKILPVMNFTSEQATCTVYDCESEEKIEFVSPMGTAKLSNCHDVQNLGAAETYMRRYLYMQVYDIVESDSLDADDYTSKSTVKETEKQEKRAATPAKTNPDKKTLIVRLIKGTTIQPAEITEWLHLNTEQEEVNALNEEEYAYLTEWINNEIERRKKS